MSVIGAAVPAAHRNVVIRNALAVRFMVPPASSDQDAFARRADRATGGTLAAIVRQPAPDPVLQASSQFLGSVEALAQARCLKTGSSAQSGGTPTMQSYEIAGARASFR
jgi:hypothetical protein